MDDNSPHYQAAIQAGAEALHAACEDRRNVIQHGPEAHEHTARVVIDAASPHLGEHIAAAIETERDRWIKDYRGQLGPDNYWVRVVFFDQPAAFIRAVTQPHGDTHTRPADDTDNIDDQLTKHYSVGGPNPDF